MSHKNHPDLFPGLRQITLQKHIDQWISQYDYLESIILYQAPPSSPYGKKYALVFELPKKPETFCLLEDKELQLRINTFLYMLNHFNGIPDIDDSFFREIHKNKTQIDYRDEWLLLIKTPDDVIKENSWVLYQKDEKVYRVNALIGDAYPEIELIYTEIKRIPDRSANADKFWKKAALEKWKENRKKMKSIKQLYLEDDELYALSGSNIKRDFVGRLLQKIVEDKGLESIGIQNLYKRYKSFRKK